jgi:hypothetical protein
MFLRYRSTGHNICSTRSNKNKSLRWVIYQIAVVCIERYHIIIFLVAVVFYVNSQHKRYIVWIWLHLHL